jgi:hypothetical protein
MFFVMFKDDKYNPICLHITHHAIPMSKLQINEIIHFIVNYI